jgi:hypothetical protein
MPISRRVVALVLAAVAAVACGSDASPAPVGTPIALPVAIREARTKPQPDGSIRIEAVSGRVTPNQPYVYPAFTHCGFTPNTFDFDGSFWSIVNAPAAFAAEANGGNPPRGIDNPVDAGVIVLTGTDSATWTSRLGFRLDLVRVASEVRTFGCD